MSRRYLWVVERRNGGEWVPLLPTCATRDGARESSERIAYFDQVETRVRKYIPIDPAPKRNEFTGRFNGTR